MDDGLQYIIRGRHNLHLGQLLKHLGHGYSKIESHFQDLRHKVNAPSQHTAHGQLILPEFRMLRSRGAVSLTFVSFLSVPSLRVRSHSRSFRSAMAPMCSTARDITDMAYSVLTTADPAEKVAITQRIHKEWEAVKRSKSGVDPLGGGSDAMLETVYELPLHPARPAVPEIVKPCSMPNAKGCGLPANVFYLHGLAHVELNAIDLCFDTFLRFHVGSSEWYDDWISIANDESRHFSWLSERLRALGYSYGCLPAHGIIWEGAVSSMHDRRTRIAVGQLVAEARGLDAGEKLAQRIRSFGDKDSARIVNVIAHEEVRHVELGIKWYLREFENNTDAAIKEFHQIAVRLGNQGAFVPPFDHEKRAQAGMLPEWYEPVADIMKQIREQKMKEIRAAKEGNKQN